MSIVYQKIGESMKHFDKGSLIVIAVTFILFVSALFFTGFTHDLLLEAGVFLVSVKLIIMAHKASVTAYFPHIPDRTFRHFHTGIIRQSGALIS